MKPRNTQQAKAYRRLEAFSRHKAAVVGVRAGVGKLVRKHVHKVERREAQHYIQEHIA